MSETAGTPSDLQPLPEPDLPAWTREFARSNAVVLMALGIIAVSAVWYSILLNHAYYRPVDFEYIARASLHPFGTGYLFRLDAGRMMPGPFLLIWVVTHMSPFDWGLASVITIVLFVIAGMTMLVLLAQLFGTRLAILVPLGLFCLAPLSVPAITTWSTAVGVLPLQIALTMMLIFHVRYVRDGGAGAAWAAIGWLLVALFFSPKAVVVPFFALAFTGAFLMAGSWGAGVRAALRRRTGIWVGYAATLFVYLAIYAGVAAGGGGVRVAGAAAVIRYAAHTLFVTVPVSLTGGGGWLKQSNDYALINPGSGRVILAWVIIALIVLAAGWLRPRGWRAWPMLVGYVIIADVGVAMLGSLSQQFATFAAQDAATMADLTVVAAVCVGLAFSPTRAEPWVATRPVPAGRIPQAIVAVLVAALTIEAFLTGNDYRHVTSSTPQRAYIAHASTALRQMPQTQELFDSPVPSFIETGFSGQYARARTLLSLLAPGLTGARWQNPTETEAPVVINPFGNLSPATVFGEQSVPPPNGHATKGARGNCWITTGTSVLATLVKPVPAGKVSVAAIEYLSPQPIFVNVSIVEQVGMTNPGSLQQAVILRQGFGRAYVPVRGPGRYLQVQFSGQPSACIGNIVVGDAIETPGQ